MLPCFLEGTYKLYKNDTSEFVRWLLENGQKCGYSPQQESGTITSKAPRINANKAKEAPKPTTQQPTTTRRVDLNELLPLANAIARSEKPKVTVPARVVRAGLRAISLRKKCSAYFQDNDADDVEIQTTDRHLHFISLMENVVLALEHAFEANGTSATSPLSSESFLELENRFTALDVEELSDNESSPTRSNIDAAFPTIKLQNSRNKDEEEEEKNLAIYCLFKDLSTLQDYVLKAWEQYHRKELDLVTVSVTTNTAFQLAMRTQEECLSAYPELANHAVLMKLFVDKPSWLKTPPYSIYWTELYCLEEFCDIGGWIPTRGSSKQRLPKNLSLSGDEGKIKNIEALMELLPEFLLIWDNEIFHKYYTLDELSRGLCEAKKTKRIEVWLSFAASCLVVISRSPIAKLAFDDFQQVCTHTSETLKTHLKYSSEMISPVGWQVWKDYAQGFTAGIEEYYRNDALFEVKRDFLYKKDSHKFPGESERFYLLKRQPVLCGVLAFCIILDLQSVGLALVNLWATATYPGHIYNALRHRKSHIPFKPWPLMDELISVHTEERFFLGAAPKTLNDSLKQVCLMCGMSAQQFAPASKWPHEKSIRSKNGCRVLKVPSVLGKIFAGKHETKPETGVFTSVTMENVEELLNHQAKEAEVAADPQNKFLKQEWARTKRLSTVQLLDALKSALRTELWKMKFDYFTFHQQSMDFVRDFAKSLKRSGLKILPAEVLEEDKTPLAYKLLYHVVWYEVYQPTIVPITPVNGKVQTPNLTLMDEFAKILDEHLDPVKLQNRKARIAMIEGLQEKWTKTQPPGWTLFDELADLTDPQRKQRERRATEIDKLKEDLEEMRRNLGNAKFKSLLGSVLNVPAAKGAEKKDAPKSE